MTDEFLYRVYEELDGSDLFPPGMDEYTFASWPVTIQVGGGRFPTTLPQMLASIIEAYKGVKKSGIN